MESVPEVFIVSDSGSKDTNCSIYDLTTGRLLDTFKEGHSIRNGLASIADDYLISAFKDRPIMKVWTLNQSNREECRMSVPGIVTALAVTKCGAYCVAGIGKWIHIWEVSTGNLLANLEYHVQDITCVRFTSDGSHFITGGKDGMVLVFLLYETIIIKDDANESPKIHFTWTDHAAEITDIYVGINSFCTRVATASKDMTCRIYELDTGYLLSTIHVGFPITAVLMDACEYFLFLGSTEGDICKINLFSIKDTDLHYEDIVKKIAFLGHSKEITSLCVSSSGKYLLSGSADRECRMWDIASFSCVRKLTYSGPVTNVLCTFLPLSLKNEKRVPRTSLNIFKKSYSEEDEEEEFIPTHINTKELSLIHAGSPDDFFDPQILKCSTETLEKIMMRGNITVEDMSRINNTMYSFTLGDAFYELESDNDSEDSN